jgi:hypothetical protein
MLRETDLFEIEERGELQIKVGTFKICSGFCKMILIQRNVKVKKMKK